MSYSAIGGAISDTCTKWSHIHSSPPVLLLPTRYCTWKDNLHNGTSDIGKHKRTSLSPLLPYFPLDSRAPMQSDFSKIPCKHVADCGFDKCPRAVESMLVAMILRLLSDMFEFNSNNK